MNVRIAQDEIRFRVAPDEFSRLCNGDTVDLESIPLTFTAQASRNENAADLAIDVSCAGFHLVLPPAKLRDLKSKLPCREGLETVLILENGKQLRVGFEVDIRKV